jgi:hypothetical protein
MGQVLGTRPTLRNAYLTGFCRKCLAPFRQLVLNLEIKLPVYPIER